MEFYEDGIIVNGEKISIDDIKKGMSKWMQENTNNVMVTFKWMGFRGFEEGIEETFLADKDKIDKFISIIKNRPISFGEIAGKHSDVNGTIDDEDIIIHKAIDVSQLGYDHSFLDHIAEAIEYEEREDISKEDAEFAKEFIEGVIRE